jgi:hypothetical protein
MAHLPWSWVDPRFNRPQRLDCARPVERFDSRVSSARVAEAYLPADTVKSHLATVCERMTRP